MLAPLKESGSVRSWSYAALITNARSARQNLLAEIEKHDLQPEVLDDISTCCGEMVSNGFLASRPNDTVEIDLILEGHLAIVAIINAVSGPEVIEWWRAALDEHFDRQIKRDPGQVQAVQAVASSPADGVSAALQCLGLRPLDQKGQSLGAGLAIYLGMDVCREIIFSGNDQQTSTCLVFDLNWSTSS